MMPISCYRQRIQTLLLFHGGGDRGVGSLPPHHVEIKVVTIQEGGGGRTVSVREEESGGGKGREKARENECDRITNVLLLRK
jgi:hypothetical protein